MWEKSAFGSQAGPHSGRDGAVMDELKGTAREAGWWGKRKISRLPLPGGGEDAVICLSQVLKDFVARISLNLPDLSLSQSGHYAKFFKARVQW